MLHARRHQNSKNCPKWYGKHNKNKATRVLKTESRSPRVTALPACFSWPWKSTAAPCCGRSSTNSSERAWGELGDEKPKSQPLSLARLGSTPLPALFKQLLYRRFGNSKAAAVCCVSLQYAEHPSVFNKIQGFQTTAHRPNRWRVGQT